MHSHKCGACGLLWHHSNEMRGIPEAHKCPRCGAAQWQQYHHGNDPLPGQVAQVQPQSLPNTIADWANAVAMILFAVGAGYIVYRYIREGGAAALGVSA